MNAKVDRLAAELAEAVKLLEQRRLERVEAEQERDAVRAQLAQAQGEVLRLRAALARIRDRAGEEFGEAGYEFGEEASAPTAQEMERLREVLSDVGEKARAALIPVHGPDGSGER